MVYSQRFACEEVSLRRAPGLTLVLSTPKGLHGRKIDINSIRLMPYTGRGIVAARNIQARSIVDINPVLVMPFEDLNAVKSTTLNHYT